MTGLISINNTLLRQDATGNDDGNHHGFVEILPEGKKVSIFRDNSPIDNVDAAYDVPAGQYFVVGDNRGNSEDSRNMLGYIQLGDIIGKVTVVLWNDQSYKISYRPVE